MSANRTFCGWKNGPIPVINAVGLQNKSKTSATGCGYEVQIMREATLVMLRQYNLCIGRSYCKESCLDTVAKRNLSGVYLPKLSFRKRASATSATCWRMYRVNRSVSYRLKLCRENCVSALRSASLKEEAMLVDHMIRIVRIFVGSYGSALNCKLLAIQQYQLKLWKGGASNRSALLWVMPSISFECLVWNIVRAPWVAKKCKRMLWVKESVSWKLSGYLREPVE